MYRSQEEIELDEAILAAHASGDGEILADCYYRGAILNFNNGDVKSGAFLLTQAYVFALECGMDLAIDIHAKLVELGREAP